MRKITIDLNSISQLAIFNNTVRQGENLATQIEFILDSDFAGYKYLMLLQLNNKAPVSTSELIPVDGKGSYILTNATTNETGTLRVELHAYDDTGALIKTAYINLKVAQSINGLTEVMPEAYVPWYIQAVEQASIATEEASKLANYNAEMNERIDNLVSGLTQESEVIDSRSSSVKGKTFVNLKTRLEENEQDLAEHKLDYTEHLNSTMPHKIENLKTGKTYRYGYQISAEGIPQVISEEVI